MGEVLGLGPEKDVGVGAGRADRGNNDVGRGGTSDHPSPLSW